MRRSTIISIISTCAISLFPAQELFGFTTDGYNYWTWKLSLDAPNRSLVYNESSKQLLFLEPCCDGVSNYWLLNVGTFNKKLYSLIRKFDKIDSNSVLSLQENLEPAYIPLAKAVQRATRIGQPFKTRNGFKLGLSQKQTERIYGKPHKIIREAGYTVFRWNYRGEYSYTDGAIIDSLVTAENCFDYKVKVFFITNQAVASEITIGPP